MNMYIIANKCLPKCPVTSSRTKNISSRELMLLLTHILLRPMFMGFANVPTILKYIQTHYPRLYNNHSREYLRKRIVYIAKQHPDIFAVWKSGGINYIELRRIPAEYFADTTTIDLISIRGGRETRKPRRNTKISIADRRARYERSSVQHILYERPKTDERERASLEDYLFDMFLAYVRRVSRQILTFYDTYSNTYVFVRQKNRYIDPSLNRDQLRKFMVVFNHYAKEFKKGVFLTITLPPVFPLGLYPKLFTYIIKQLMAWIRKRNKGKKIRLIRVNEFQENGMLHVHLVIFGINYICDKQELTVRLDMWLVNSLLRLYKYIDDRIVNLMISRYLRYCRSNPGYTGPVNFVTAVDFVKRTWRLPPDLHRFLSNLQNTQQTQYDGAGVFVDDYLSKYLSKFIGFSRDVEEYVNRGFDPSVFDDHKKKRIKSLKFLMYWVTGIKYFSLDYKIYSKLGLSRSNYTNKTCVFIGSYDISNMPEYLWRIYSDESIILSDRATFYTSSYIA